MSSPHTPETLDACLARLLVERGVASHEEVEYARGMVAARKSADFTLTGALLENGVITAKQAERLAAECAAAAGKTSDSAQQLPGYQMLENLAPVRWPRSTRPSS